MKALNGPLVGTEIRDALTQLAALYQPPLGTVDAIRSGSVSAKQDQMGRNVVCSAQSPTGSLLSVSIVGQSDANVGASVTMEIREDEEQFFSATASASLEPFEAAFDASATDFSMSWRGELSALREKGVIHVNGSVNGLAFSGASLISGLHTFNANLDYWLPAEVLVRLEPLVPGLLFATVPYWRKARSASESSSLDVPWCEIAAWGVGGAVGGVAGVALSPKITPAGGAAAGAFIGGALGAYLDDAWCG